MNYSCWAQRPFVEEASSCGGVWEAQRSRKPSFVHGGVGKETSLAGQAIKTGCSGSGYCAGVTSQRVGRDQRRRWNRGVQLAQPMHRVEEHVVQTGSRCR